MLATEHVGDFTVSVSLPIDSEEFGRRKARHYSKRTTFARTLVSMLDPRERFLTPEDP